MVIRDCVKALREKLSLVKNRVELYDAFTNVVMCNLTYSGNDEIVRDICSTIASTVHSLPRWENSQKIRESLCWYAKREVMYSLHVVFSSLL